VIELPATVYPRSAKPALLDFGFTVRPASGAPAQRYNRLGSRYVVEFELPVMDWETARIVKARLTRAKQDALRMPMPLAQGLQGNPGAAQVDGTDSAGTTLKLKNLTPGWIAREGYWLNVTDADGVRYLHDVATTVRAGSDGKAVLTLGVPLRTALANSSEVLIAKPVVEGLLISDVNFEIPVGQRVAFPAITIEELR
jgi:hypothetical protein